MAEDFDQGSNGAGLDLEEAGSGWRGGQESECESATTRQGARGLKGQREHSRQGRVTNRRQGDRDREAETPGSSSLA